MLRVTGGTKLTGREEKSRGRCYRGYVARRSTYRSPASEETFGLTQAVAAFALTGSEWTVLPVPGF